VAHMAVDRLLPTTKYRFKFNATKPAAHNQRAVGQQQQRKTQ